MPRDMPDVVPRRVAVKLVATLRRDFVADYKSHCVDKENTIC